MKGQLSKPPVCDCCGRHVIKTSSKPLLSGADSMLCGDCWDTWYDGGSTDPATIQAIVLRQFGDTGGRGGLSNMDKIEASERGE